MNIKFGAFKTSYTTCKTKSPENRVIGQKNHTNRKQCRSPPTNSFHSIVGWIQRRARKPPPLSVRMLALNTAFKVFRKLHHLTMQSDHWRSKTHRVYICKYMYRVYSMLGALDASYGKVFDPFFLYRSIFTLNTFLRFTFVFIFLFFASVMVYYSIFTIEHIRMHTIFILHK